MRKSGKDIEKPKGGPLDRIQSQREEYKQAQRRRWLRQRGITSGSPSRPSGRSNSNSTVTRKGPPSSSFVTSTTPSTSSSSTSSPSKVKKKGKMKERREKMSDEKLARLLQAEDDERYARILQKKTQSQVKQKRISASIKSPNNRIGSSSGTSSSQSPIDQRVLTRTSTSNSRPSSTQELFSMVNSDFSNPINLFADRLLANLSNNIRIPPSPGHVIDLDNMTYEQIIELQNRVGNADCGLSDHDIQSLSTKFKVKDKKQEIPNEEPSCAICFVDFEIGDEVRRLGCFHLFHCDCIDIWLKKKATCPVCRKDIREMNKT